MKKVITYGTYDLLHYGHVNLLKRAKELGDYLIVGVTADDFDKRRGKINVQQPLMERIEAIKGTGIADQIIVEEYEGQKIDDIKKYGIDIFAIGSDWLGKFDYLKDLCSVVYLERTMGVSSSEIRSKNGAVKLGLVGDSSFLNKVKQESAFVNGINVDALCTNKLDLMSRELQDVKFVTPEYDAFLNHVDAVYVRSIPELHYEQCKKALLSGKHVLCESPLTLESKQSQELFDLAISNELVLMEAIKTAYSTAFLRLVLLIKGGKIGKVVSVDATCTSLRKIAEERITDWRGIYEWGPTGLLPVFMILGTEYKKVNMVASFHDKDQKDDSFTKIDFIYDNAVASIKVGNGVKSEGELIVSGTQGYIYVPAPWWKTDYFEVRYENATDNKRYFYQLEGEGIRYELVAFARAIENKCSMSNIDSKVSFKISEVVGDFIKKNNMTII